MANLTLSKAKKILGKLAEGVSDDQLAQEIKTAEILKVLYFNQLKKTRTEIPYNKNSYGKT